MTGIGDSTLFPNSKMAAAVQLGQSRFKSGEITSVVGSGGGSISAEATAFLARTSGLNTTHTNAYTAMIDGLVADGVWSKLDVLHVYATQDSTTAQLNLISSSYPATVNGAPTFTADRGYQGTEGSSSIYINTGFNPTSASTPKYVQNSAHISCWIVTNNTGTATVGVGDNLTGTAAYVFPRAAGNLMYVRINDNQSGGGAETVANSDSRGHFIVNRSGASAAQGYKNGSQALAHTNSSFVVPNRNMYALGYNSLGTPSGYGQQEAMISIGSSLSSTDVTNFYNRLRTYMTAVGVP